MPAIASALLLAQELWPSKARRIHRTIGNDFVEKLLVGQSGGAEGRISPAHARESMALRDARRRTAFTRFWISATVLRAVQIDLRETERTFHEVDVTVGEAGQDQLALGVDHFGGRSAIAGNLFRAAYGENLVAANGKRFRPGLLRFTV